MSHKAGVTLRGRYYPVVGTVCMDMIMVNLGPADVGPGLEVQVDDDAVLFGPTGLSASELAHHAGTINYEILTGVQQRAHRVYVDG